jgi:hypothetical protein
MVAPGLRTETRPGRSKRTSSARLEPSGASGRSGAVEPVGDAIAHGKLLTS